MALNLISHVKKLSTRMLLVISVTVSTVMSCFISGIMSLLFHGHIAYDYIITGAVASIIIATIIVYIILELKREIKTGEKDLKIKDTELSNVKSQVNQLKGLLPICSKCKKIRDDKGYWNFLESYIEHHSEAFFSHGICPECADSLYGDDLCHSEPACSVSGLNIKTDPGWMMGDSTTPFQLRLSVLGDRILYSRPSGFATSTIIKKSVELEKKAEAYILKHHASYIHIGNLGKLSGFTINARLVYINHFKHRTGIRYMIFCGVPYLTSLSIKLATKLYRFDFQVKVVRSYQEAVHLAEELLKKLDESVSNSRTEPSLQIDEKRNGQQKIKIQVQSNSSWVAGVSGYTSKYEIINHNIIHCVAAGHFNTEQIAPMIKIQKQMYDRVKDHPEGYHMVADVTGVTGTDYKARLNYIKAQNDFYKKYPFRSLSFYGASKMLKPAFHLGSAFVKFKLHLGDSLEQVLQSINNDSQQMLSGRTTKENENYVKDVLDYLGILNPDIELSGLKRMKPLKDHPFRPVFEAIDLINDDLEQLAMERQKNEQYKLDMERRFLNSQKMEALGTLSGGIAHDFNNILSGIFGYSQLIDNHANEPGKINQYNQKIFEGAKRAAHLIRQILSFSRHTKFIKQPVHIKDILDEVISLLRSTIPSNIEIKSAVNSKRKIHADPTQMHQVIMNLCTNAYQAMKGDGGILTIQGGEEVLPADLLKDRSGDPCEKYFKLSVGDTGPGIEDHIKEKIFDPYFTTKEIDSGTGLGLAVVAGIVKEHNGFIDLDTRIHTGTTVHLYFPILKDDVPASTDTVIQKKKTSFGEERILIVDDEQAILDTLKIILSRKGYDITTFPDGESALNSFVENPDQYDLAITDMIMPKMNGDKLSKEIMKIRADIPIIMCTGFNEQSIKDNAVCTGIKKFIQKPVTGSELAAAIRDVMDND